MPSPESAVDITNEQPVQRWKKSPIKSLSLISLETKLEIL
jgi:hypothetical protein